MKARKTRILADLPAHLLSRPRTWIAVGVTLVTLVVSLMLRNVDAPANDLATGQGTQNEERGTPKRGTTT